MFMQIAKITLMLICQWNSANLAWKCIAKYVLMHMKLVGSGNNAQFSNSPFPSKIQINSSEKCNIFVMRICEI
jgi:hypothetical protein